MKNELGELEELILLAILKENNNDYGILIQRTLAEAGREVNVGALYLILSRLETKGFVSVRVGEITKERGGKAKRYYSVTFKGKRAAQKVESIRKKLRGIDTSS